MRANLRRFTVLTMSGRHRARLDGRGVRQSSPATPTATCTSSCRSARCRPGGTSWTSTRSTAPWPTRPGGSSCPTRAAGMAVVSDIDDTILKTGLTQRLDRCRAHVPARRRPTASRSRACRRSTPGLARGDRGPARACPFFYVSTGSWNFYDYLVAFTQPAPLPARPAVPDRLGPHLRAADARRPGAQARHDPRTARRATRTTTFVLVGDVGQGDPETYEVMAREFPGRIRRIFLIYVGSHLAERSEQVAARAAACARRASRCTTWRTPSRP